MTSYLLQGLHCGLLFRSPLYVFFQYVLIKGMADYKDGTRRKDWQQYSALMAASVLRTVVECMPPPPS